MSCRVEKRFKAACLGRAGIGKSQPKVLLLMLKGQNTPIAFPALEWRIPLSWFGITGLPLDYMSAVTKEQGLLGAPCLIRLLSCK